MHFTASCVCINTFTGVQFHLHHQSLSPLSVCGCLSACIVMMLWLLLHRPLCYSPSLSLSLCKNRRLRERERIIMFPLLSRLPQLSLKRGSRNTCLLIHLKQCNNRTPRFPAISPSPSPSVFISPTCFFLTFPYQLSIHSTGPQYAFSPSLCAPTSAPSHLMRFPCSLASPTNSTWISHRDLPPLLVSPPFLQCLAAGQRERKNEETKHFRLYTARGKAADWFPQCCFRRDYFVCLACVNTEQNQTDIKMNCTWHRSTMMVCLLVHPAVGGRCLPTLTLGLLSDLWVVRRSRSPLAWWDAGRVHVYVTASDSWSEMYCCGCVYILI